MLLSVEVIIGPLLLTNIIGVCCDRRTKSINRIYSNNSVSNIEARGTYSNHCGLSDLYRNHHHHHHHHVPEGLGVFPVP